MRREAAVLVPIHRIGERGWTVVLVRRAAGGLHGGQLAFPGGRREARDDSLEATALREAEEEIGLPHAAVRVVAALPPIETLTSRFSIHPFLGVIRRPPEWSAEPREVAEVLEVPLLDLARPEAAGTSVERLPGLPAPRTIRFFRVGPYRLWGATYRILEPLLPRILGGEWDL